MYVTLPWRDVRRTQRTAAGGLIIASGTDRTLVRQRGGCSIVYAFGDDARVDEVCNVCVRDKVIHTVILYCLRKITDFN